MLYGALEPHLRQKRLALLYAGNWLLPLRWERLAEFTDWHFLTLNPPPFMVPNLSLAPRAGISHPDLVASVDLVIAKPGYGMVGECLGAGTPHLYCPRHGFAEYAALDRALSAWEGGFRLTSDAFIHVEWGTVLSQIPGYGTVPPTPLSGGERAAAIMEQIYREAL